MSQKAFYQTLYQTEQIFRLPDDLLDFGNPPVQELSWEPEPVDDALPLPVIDTLLIDRDDAVVSVLMAAVANSLDTEEIAEPVEQPTAEFTDFIPATPADDEQVMPEVPLTVIIGEALAPAPRPVTPEPERPVVRTPDLNHKVLILVDEELMPSELLFLERVLKAVNLNPDNVDLLNLHGWQGRDFGPVLTHKVVHHFITFGVPFERLNLDILMDRYHPVRFDGITFMLADALGVIEADRDLKKRLWDSLQRIFLQR